MLIEGDPGVEGFLFMLTVNGTEVMDTAGAPLALGLLEEDGMEPVLSVLERVTAYCARSSAAVRGSVPPRPRPLCPSSPGES